MSEIEKTQKLDMVLEILKDGEVHIPKKIWLLDDIYTETKIMFAIVLSEKTDAIECHKTFPLDEVIEVYKSVDVEEIMTECLCGKQKAQLIKDEMIEIAKNIEDYLDVPIERRSEK